MTNDQRVIRRPIFRRLRRDPHRAPLAARFLGEGCDCSSFRSLFSGSQAASRAGQDFGPSDSKTLLSGWKTIQANQNPSMTSIPSGISKSKRLVFES